jgi:translation initiation factor IF-2
MTEEIKSILSTMLSPIVEEKYIGNADVRKIFMISKIGTIAGCYVTDGLIKRSDTKIKVIRDGKQIFEGKIRSMRHEKDEIKESRQSHECGILAEGFNDFQEGDQIECYEIILKSRSVD